MSKHFGLWLVIMTILVQLLVVVGCQHQVEAPSIPSSEPMPTPTPTPTPKPMPTPTPTPKTTLTPTPMDESKVHFEQGNIYLEQEEWDKAITEFDKVINPELEKAARVGRGIANTWAGNYKQAENDFNPLAMTILVTADAEVAWGIALTAQYSSYSKLSEAEYLFDSAISRDPNNPDAYTGRALLYLKKANVAEADSIFYNLGHATSNFQKSIELDPEGIQGRIRRFNFEGNMAFLPNYIEANNWYGALLVGASGDDAANRALEAYNRVLKVVPKNVEALVGRGNAYMALGQNDKAILSFNVALQLEPYNADTYAGRAVAYTKDKQYDLAIADFEKTIELDDGYGRGECNDAYATRGSLVHPEENVIGFAPSYIDAYTSRGYAHLDDGKYPLAIADFSKAIAFQADRGYADSKEEYEFGVGGRVNTWALAVIGRGISYTRSMEYENALDDFDIANLGREYFTAGFGIGSITRNPFTTPSQVYIAWGVASSWMGRYMRAIEHFEMAELYTDFSMDVDAYLARGYAYKFGYESLLHEGWKAQAIADFQEFIALAPGSPRIAEAQQYIRELTR